ncbi:unnamed protein product [Trifolium pratense]|uniref:Uncharacterized protein n=1 Tax=Trifolium pratense TaxID=57577 RepID=A0ACB0ITA5_TRIPR|nr:unnamed protein product [Trifolium pratense]
MDLEILHDRDAIWYNLLSFKYGEVHKFFCAEYIVTNRTNSVWWRDLVKIGIGSGALIGLLNGVVRKKLGNGHNTSFWHDKWIGVIPLKNVYPRLFSVSVDKDSSVAESGRLDLDGDRWIWHWCWRRQLFNWEEALADELKDTLDGVGPTKEGNDKRVWKLNTIEGFSVSSCYQYIISILSDHPIDLILKKALLKVWKTDVPTKAQVMAWRLLQGRLAT